MTKKELMNKIGKEENELINTNLGFLEVMDIHDGSVLYGFLANGHMQCEPIEKFLGRFGK